MFADLADGSTFTFGSNPFQASYQGGEDKTFDGCAMIAADRVQINR